MPSAPTDALSPSLQAIQPSAARPKAVARANLLTRRQGLEDCSVAARLAMTN
jgi:hypothetical protein